MKIIQLILIVVIYVTNVFGQNRGSTIEDKNKSNLKTENNKSKDEEFVIKAAKGGMKEVAMGNEGNSKASNARVKNFANMMVRDHTKANNELKEMAAKHKIKLPSDNDKMDMHNSINKTGADYDKEYMHMMVKDHMKDIDLFKMESKNGKNAEWKSWASKMLPTLQMHLDSAKAIESSLTKFNQ